MPKVREYTIKVKPTGNQLDLSVGQRIDHATYISLGIQKDRVDVNEYSIDKDRVEEALAFDPLLYLVPGTIEKITKALKPDNNKAEDVDSIKDEIKEKGGNLPKGKKANDKQALNKILSNLKDDN